MKKLFLFAAILFFAFPAIAQDQEEDYNYSDFSVIGRLDLNPYYPLSSGDGIKFSHANSGIYTIFEGSTSEHFSWLLVNHWIHANSGEEDYSYAWPYKNLGRSDDANWIDYCQVNLTFSNWNFTIGKDATTTGGFEFEDWDWDVTYNFSSPLWNEFVTYQWGAKAAYTTNSEKTTLSLQATTSGFGEYPFKSGLFQYSAQWKGVYGWFSNIWSASYVQEAKGQFEWLIALGQRFTFSDSWNFTLDWNNFGGNYFAGTLQCAPLDKWDFNLRAAVCDWDFGELGNSAPLYWRAGVECNFYPIKDSDSLRVIGSCMYDKIYGCVDLTIGVRYNLALHLW